MKMEAIEFIVTKQIGDFAPRVAESFDNEKDAVAYAEIMRRKQDGWKYSVYRIIAA